MTGRTCQLCGKPLSRFSVGSGGDFCSREHRSQFRLRLGMDRLTEANKVASLMRRRENAKAFPAAQLTTDYKGSPRAAGPIRVPVSQAALRTRPLLTVALEPTAISAVSRGPRPLRPAANPAGSVARLLESTDSFTGRQTRPMLPTRSIQFSAQLLAAGIARSRSGSSSIKQRRREATLGWSLARTCFGVDGIQIRPAPLAIRSAQEPQKALPLTSSADRGRDLRVSGGSGFRLPAMRIRVISFDGPRAASLVNSTQPRNTMAASRPKGADARRADMRFTIRGLLGPTPPTRNGAVHFHWPSVLAPGGSVPRQAAFAARTCSVEWSVVAPCAPELRLKNGVARMRDSGNPLPVAAGATPHGIESAQRVTLVAFEPQDAPVPCSPSALHDALVAGMQFGLTAIKKTESSGDATIEEHFDAGLQNWLGETGDWKVDVAGVRAGSLALFTPSMESSNYLLEFLARIENRTISWVFRAASFTDYYQAILAVAPAGGYEFRRSAVIDGVAETPIGCPVGPASQGPTAKTAVTVRTRVSGSEFIVSLDGKVIDTWTDSRLATGGIGFVGAPDDRARLYWVKVTPAGHNNKEYSKK